jgi:hypothetical protein
LGQDFDESSLWDFHGDESNEALPTKIKEVYGVDVSDIRSGEIIRDPGSHRRVAMSWEIRDCPAGLIPFPSNH